ncbi:MAG: TetR/AcrR family transcriptional regulator [Clostridia bacterium]|nr:TetR/AcrR family transcriptional regulator [Clostridia bacterium]
MSETEIRKPIQKRSIETKDKIVEAGFDLICNDGYYNTNTSKIAKKAGVSTGIIYQYFKDKKDILMAGLEKYADDMFYPMLNMSNVKFEKKDISSLMKNMIKKYISNHKLSASAHEEITAMAHSDKDIAKFFYEREIEMTKRIADSLIENGFKIDNVYEKVHIVIGMVDNLCHEIVYHKHKEIDYEAMTDIVANNTVDILIKS